MERGMKVKALEYTEKRTAEGKRCREYIKYMQYVLGTGCLLPLEKARKEKELAHFVNSIRR